MIHNDNKKNLTDFTGRLSEISKEQEDILLHINEYIKAHTDRPLECDVNEVRMSSQITTYPSVPIGIDEKDREELFLLIHKYASLLEEKASFGFDLVGFDAAMFSYSELLRTYKEKSLTEAKYLRDVAYTYRAFEIEWLTPELFGNFPKIKQSELVAGTKGKH